MWQVHTLTSDGWDLMRSVAFSPDGKFVVGGSDEDKLVKIWDAETGAKVRSFVAAC